MRHICSSSPFTYFAFSIISIGEFLSIFIFRFNSDHVMHGTKNDGSNDRRVVAGYGLHLCMAFTEPTLNFSVLQSL
jgi:hypothetical protein